MTMPEKPRERWQELAELASKEPDPGKLLALVRELNDALEEKQSPARSLFPPKAHRDSAL